MSGTRGGSNDATLPLIATDTVAGEAFQRVKLDVGAAGASVPVEGALPVSATNLDIRALSQFTDSIGVSGSVTVTGTDLDIRALSSTTDSVTVAGSVSATGPTAIGDAYGSSKPVPIGGIVRASGTTADEGDAMVANFDGSGSLNVSVTGGSVSATVANDVWTVDRKNAVGARFDVAASSTSVSISSGNYTGGGTTIWNDSAAVLYLDLSGGTATASSCSLKLAADAYYEVPFNYTGAITGAWSSNTGYARVTWFSPAGWD